MSELIIANIVVLSLIALAAALVLYFAAQKFKVAGNPLADKIAALLPQANCGACGKARLSGFCQRLRQCRRGSLCPPILPGRRQPKS